MKRDFVTAFSFDRVADDDSPPTVSVILICAGNERQLFLIGSTGIAIIRKLILIDDLDLIYPVVIDGAVKLNKLNVIAYLALFQLRKERGIPHVMAQDRGISLLSGLYRVFVKAYAVSQCHAVS